MSLFRHHKLPSLPDIMRGKEPLSRIRIAVNYREYLFDNISDPAEIGEFLSRCAELYAMDKPIGHEFKVHVTASQTSMREFDRLEVPLWAHTTDEIRYEYCDEFSDYGHVFFITYHYRKVAHSAPRRRRAFFKKSSAH